MVAQHLPNRLREIRQVLGLTQADIVRRSGLSPREVKRIEDGELSPRIVTARRLAAAVGCSLDTLFPEPAEAER